MCGTGKPRMKHDWNVRHMIAHVTHSHISLHSVDITSFLTKLDTQVAYVAAGVGCVSATPRDANRHPAGL